MPSKKNGPFEITSSEVKYENPWVSVREDKVLRPNGKAGLFGVVTILPGVSVLAIDDEGLAYLTQEFHYGVEQETVEVVSGGIDKGEDPLAAGKRELEEELGIRADEWIDLGEMHPLTTIINCPHRLYLAHGLRFGESHPEETEQITLLKVSFKEVVKMAMESKILHGPSLAVIFRAAIYLNTKA